jgi:tetratricopeptide (TPR) repeat protein
MARAPKRKPAPRSRTNDTAPLLALAVIVAATLAAYGRVGSFGFIENYDDSLYVTTNPHVNTGFSAANVAWAFTHSTAGNWHPLTMLSHMADVQLFGVSAGPAHVVSLLLHVLNAVLLYVLLARVTERAWSAVFAAGLFALHPAHLESVAWIAERKDVLSTSFWLLATIAYVRYARGGGAPTYALVVLAFAAGLMSKPMLVTFPFTLLLLDAWPLARLSWRAVAEKLPLFALSAAAIVIALRTQGDVGAYAGHGALSLGFRLGNACIATARYLEVFFAPHGFAAYYPYPAQLDHGAVVLSALLLIGVTATLVGIRRAAPYALVGWLWFLGTLVPVSGLVQVGGQSMADRYTYVPYIGLAIALAWSAADLARARGIAPRVLAAAAAAALVVLAVLTWQQSVTWRDGHAVFARAVAVTQDNAFAWGNLGVDALAAGRLDEALADFQAAERLRPDDARAAYNLGVAYRKLQRFPEAEGVLARSLQLAPGDPHAELNLAMVLAAQRRYADATPHYEAALRGMPDDPDTRLSYSNALSNAGAEQASAGRRDAAVALFRRALEVMPGNEQARANLELATGGASH